MSRALKTLAAAALLACLCAPPARASFGLHDLEVAFEEQGGSAALAAGSHPFAMRTHLAIDTEEDPVLKSRSPPRSIKDLRVDLPPGFVADRDAAAHARPPNSSPPGGGEPLCPAASVIGEVEVEIGQPRRGPRLPPLQPLPDARLGGAARLQRDRRCR